jgi:hypothetical protein
MALSYLKKKKQLDEIHCKEKNQNNKVRAALASHTTKNHTTSQSS